MKKILLVTIKKVEKGKKESAGKNYDLLISLIKDILKKGFEFEEIKNSSSLDQATEKEVYGIVFFSQTMLEKAKEMAKEKPTLKIVGLANTTKNRLEEGVFIVGKTTEGFVPDIRDFFNE
jgi:DNA-binding transcriptional MerR regulator